jgi:hypothetical protein
MERAPGITNEDRERTELDAVLTSTLFARAPDLSKILRYVCEKHFASLADAIKEYNIAVEALGRGPDFRPDADSIVRVQAARLRKHLKKYYETDGAGHRVQIRISASGYKPEFVHAVVLDGQSVIPVETRGAEDDDSGENGGPIDAEARPPLSRKWLYWLLALVAAVLALAGAAVHRSHASGGELSKALVPPPGAPPGLNVRAGLDARTFLDAEGSLWTGDRYFTGGQTFDRPGNQVLRTFDQSLYQTGRMGNFSYAIPLQPGVYELHLHFAEIFFSPTVGADTQRTFDVSINGSKALNKFDTSKDAGGVYIADEKVFKDISPAADGFLHLGFEGVRNQALLNGFEVLPGVRGRMLPVRILCSNHSAVDKNGFLWKADQYFSGGRIAERADAIPDPDMGGLSSYRTGNFNYAIPVAEGVYRVRMVFAEPVYGRDTVGDGTGLREFDVYCNGKTVASGLDVYREAGGPYKVVEKALRHVKPDAQGKIVLSFVPVRSYAVLLAIEVVDDSD